MNIALYLKENDACLSTKLTEIFVQKGVKPAAARQRISRAVSKGLIQRLHGISFPKGVSFLYHKSAYGSPSFWDALISAIDEKNPTYAATIYALHVRGGIVLLKYFPIISGSPVRQQKQISSDSVLERLKSIGIIQIINYENIGEYVTFNDLCPLKKIGLKEFKAQAIAENILISAVKDWVRKINIVSYDAVQCRDDKDELPKVGTFNWDLCGPSFLRPFFRKGKDGGLKAGFFVCDIAVDAVMDEKSIKAFIRKCKLTSNLKNLPPILFCIVAKGFTKKSFALARSEGIMVCTIANLFGKDVVEGLASLIKTLTKMAAMAAHRPEIIDEIFSKIGHIEGAAKNIRGSLFEFLVGHCVLKKDCGSIDIGKAICDIENGKTYEIDVFRVREDQEVWAYECKAHQPTELVKLEDVEFWHKQRVVPLARILHNEARFRECEFHFEYWTCGGFTEEASEYLRKVSQKTRKYKIGFKDGNAVREYIKTIKSRLVLKSFDQHFFKHPISRIEESFVRKTGVSFADKNSPPYLPISKDK